MNECIIEILCFQLFWFVFFFDNYLYLNINIKTHLVGGGLVGFISMKKLLF